MPRKEFRFADLVHSGSWQSIQDDLSESLGLSIRTYSPSGSLLTDVSRPNPICDGMLNKDRVSMHACGVLAGGSSFDNIRKTTAFKGPFGVDIYVIPVRAVGDNIVAYIFLGPVILRARRDPAEYAKEAAEMGIDADELQDAIIDLNVFSYSKIDVIVKLVTEIFSHIAQSGYHKRRLGEIAPEIEELDPLFSAHYEERILGNLLSCCSLALNADSGSVMIVDKKTQKLHIKVAERIDQDIIDSTEIKIGEGIAGLAAAKAESIILPYDQNKNHLNSKMNRKYIKSSMIVPFSRANEENIYGVINLNIVKKEAGFTEREVSLVKELVNMASVALIPVNA